MSEDEYREHRRLFFATMRHPAMRLLRLALRYLAWNKGMDWRDIQRIEMIPYAPGCWMLLTDRFLVVSVNVSPAMTYEDFFFTWLHDVSGMNSDNAAFFAPALAEIDAIDEAFLAKITANNLTLFFEDLCQYVEKYWTPLFVEHDGERTGWQSDPAIPPGRGVECRRRDQFYAYCINDELGLDFLADSQGEDAVYGSYEDALEAIKALA